ncbi:DUF2971 domain-containing protein [Bradyrhizobium sp. B124]|uniref:DUF2971 domain-containing protein n=1 Tax=Bradyrhizobium sp. B124 TaxID=3140245 RepID=UPI0031846611
MLVLAGSPLQIDEPMVLYHYTSAAALQGIISSRSLWVSDHRFLNDTTEFLYGWEIVWAALRRREADIDRASPLAWYILDSFHQSNERERAHAFVGSLTSQGDLLSQWRGYNGGRGFSIGFNAQWLQENADAQGFHLVPVLYDADAQRGAADNLAESLVKVLSNQSREQTPHRNSEQAQSCWTEALKVALSFKNNHFAEEQETRLIWIGVSWPPRLKTRIGPAGLVPYTTFHFDKVINSKISHPQNLGVEEIIVGPANRDHQVAAIDALLASNCMRLQIRRSSIPYVAD